MATEDPRKLGLKNGLRQLSISELERLAAYPYDMVLDRDPDTGAANYVDGCFCPLAVALGLDETMAEPSNEVVEAELLGRGLRIYNTRGLAGDFYTTDRRSDLLAAVAEVLVERAGALTPPLRWVGGKRRQAVDLARRAATALGPGGRYIEPFLGGGAVALAMPKGTSMVLGDACKPLGYLWWWLQQEPEAIADFASGYGFELDTGWNTQEGFTAVRIEHNTLPWSADDWRPSARFLWLMHSCFNGLYRENRSGQFNVPWGKRKRLAIPSAAALRAIADHLATAEICVGDFQPLVDAAGAGDVIYGDPPYDGDETAFTSYVATAFGPAEQARLVNAYELAISRGATVIATNADTPRVRALHSGWKIEEVTEERPVAADPGARVPARCLVMIGRCK